MQIKYLHEISTLRLTVSLHNAAVESCWESRHFSCSVWGSPELSWDNLRPSIRTQTTFPSFTSRSQSSPADDISDPFILTLHSTVIPPLQTWSHHSQYSQDFKRNLLLSKLHNITLLCTSNFLFKYSILKGKTNEALITAKNLRNIIYFLPVLQRRFW